MGNRNAAAARTVGRISLFLETYRPEDDLAGLKTRVEDLQAQVSQLERDSGVDDSAERLASILNLISNRISRYAAELEAEFSEYPFRFDFSQLTGAQYEEPSSQEIFSRRKETVELPFGHIKHNLGVTSFLLRGLEGVRAEMSILSSCFNIVRLIGILGVTGTIERLASL